MGQRKGILRWEKAGNGRDVGRYLCTVEDGRLSKVIAAL